MKKILLLFLLLCSVYGNAQKWVLPSSKWIYTYIGYPGKIYYSDTFYVVKDTVVDNKKCYKISGGNLTYAANDTVFYWSKSQSKFVPYFLFNLTKADTITSREKVNCLETDSFYRFAFDTITQILLPGGDSLRQAHFKFVSEPKHGQVGFTVNDNYTERLSAIYGGLSFECLEYFDQYILCNYGDSTIPGFWMYPNKYCAPTGIEETIQRFSSLIISPNPASLSLHISTTEKNYEIEIVDITGRLYDNFISQQDIDVSILPKGIYFLQLKNEKGSVVKKFVKE